ncbi:hypothetical protein ACFLUV_03130 [Elusimicrobiota bacterium]
MMNKWLIRIIFLIPAALISCLTMSEYAIMLAGLFVLYIIKKNSAIITVLSVYLVWIAMLSLKLNMTVYVVIPVLILLLISSLVKSIRSNALKNEVVYIWAITGAVFLLYFLLSRIIGSGLLNIKPFLLAWFSGFIVYMGLSSEKIEKIHKDAKYLIILIMIIGAGSKMISRYYSGAGLRKLETGETIEAEKYLFTSIKLDKYNYRSYKYLAQSYLTTEDPEKAIVTLKKYLALYDNKNAIIKKMFIDLCLKTDSLKDILEVDILPVDGLSYDQSLRISEFLEKNYYFEEAIKQMNTARPSGKDELLSCGQFWRKMGQYKRAKLLIKKIKPKPQELKDFMRRCRRKRSVSDTRNEYKAYVSKNRIKMIAEKRKWVSKVRNWKKGEKTWKKTGRQRWFIEFTADGHEKIFFRIKGTPVNDIWPIINVGIDDKFIKRIYVTSDRKQYFQVGADLSPGRHRLWLEHTNGMFEKPEEYRRRLYLGKVYKVKK